MSKKLGDELIEAMGEMLAHVRGEAVDVIVHHVLVPAPIDVRAIRAKLGLSRTQFAERFKFPARTVQEWEQGRRQPDQAARAYLTVIERNPKAVEEALSAH